MKKALLATALTAALTSTAQAEIRINGFANLVGGMTSTNSEDANGNILGDVYGYTDRISFSEESLFALQASGDINDRMTATVQILARGQDDYDVDFEWAYLTYQATDKLSVSAGRFRLPIFKYSDSLDVGYSYHWIAAPRNIYDIPFNDLDGIRLDYSDFVGDWEYTLQAAAGTFENEVFGGTIDGNNTYLVSAEVSREWFNLRAVYGGTKTTFSRADQDAAFAAIGGVSPELAEVVDFLAIDDDSGEFYGIGVEIDTFDWFIGGEFTSIEIADSYTPTDEAWYVTAGARFGKWTPSVTYENFEGDELKGVDQLQAIGVQVPPLSPVVGALIPGLQGLRQSYDVVTATIRYDYDTNIALKADISRYSDDLNDAEDSTLARIAVQYVF